MSQKSGLEEVYERHNLQYNKNHEPRFLPKFHPELNPIERCWSRMKWHTRRFCDGKLESLERYMNQGLSEENLPLSLIRKYIRLVSAYYIAYNDGKDLMQADEWIRKHRSHRGFSEKMDSRLENLYFLLGRYDSFVELENSVDPFANEIELETVPDADDEEYWIQLVQDIHLA